MNKKKISITLGIVFFILTIAIAVQVRTITGTSTSGVEVEFSENNLRDEVLKWKEKYDNETKKLSEAEKTLTKIRTQTSQKDETTSTKEEQIRKNNILLGLTDVEGRGIEITIKDDPNVTTQNIGIYDDISNHIVHDGDLRMIVNELKNSGAEAISINDQRVVTTTAITCIGNVIKINDEKVNSPFVIKAIGFPESLISLNRAGGFLDYLDDYGIQVSIKKSDNIKINKYAGAITAKYMK